MTPAGSTQPRLSSSTRSLGMLLQGFWWNLASLGQRAGPEPPGQRAADKPGDIGGLLWQRLRFNSSFEPD